MRIAKVTREVETQLTLVILRNREVHACMPVGVAVECALGALLSEES
jgi:hypothetical protein